MIKTMLAAILMACAVGAYAACTQTLVVNPDGRTMYCQTCCNGSGQCQVICN